MNLNLWRSSLPSEMQWHDKDPPSTDINVARMRAKYYGARYIIHRPLLSYALHELNPNKTHLSSIESPAGFGEPSKSHLVSPSLPYEQHAADMTRIASDLGGVQGQEKKNINSYRELPQKIRTSCKICVDSAISSTEAFDRVKGRPVVTNIFGTAHAQFGNMLVLSTTYLSPPLTDLKGRCQNSHRHLRDDLSRTTGSSWGLTTAMSFQI
ncbi:hypothetical protein BJX63DRAFT_289782 [Aspergillus granulosus]|uniref:Uncharacterized protein n=1 Tax=Aspergillus granulosus TaxID=176169 RepID=A0ABR4H7H0_9EURO